MLNDYFYKNGKIISSISFNKKDLDLRISIIKKILSNMQNELLAADIAGSQENILNLYKNCKTNFKFIKNIKQGLLTKQPSLLVIASECYDDKIKIINSFTDFNEGYIDFYILDKADKTQLEKSLINFSEALNFIHSNYGIRLQIRNDAETFYIESANEAVLQNI